MELRQKGPARDIEHREISLRSNNSQGIRNSFVGKDKSPEGESFLYSRLSREEKNQWNRYSAHEKQEVLENVEKKVDRRMRLRSRTAAYEEPPPNRKSTIKKYRMEENQAHRNKSSSNLSGDSRFENDRYVNQNVHAALNSSANRHNTGNISSYRKKASYGKSELLQSGTRQPQNRVPSRSATDKNNDAHSDGSIRTESGTIRKAGKDREYRIVNGTAVRALKIERGEKNPSPGFKNATVARKKNPDRRSDDTPDNSYMNNKARSSADKKENQKDTGQPNDLQPGIAWRRYDNSVRGTPQENLKRRREQKRAGDEKKKRNKEFVNEFKHTLSQAGKKTRNIDNEIRSEQISQSEMENQTLNDVVHTASTPFRAVGGRIIHGITSFIGSALSSFMKYVAGFGGFFVIFFVILIFFVALLAGTIQENSSDSGGLASGDGEAIVEYAKEWIGITKYVYGAGRDYETDWQDYADCSSFVHGVYSHFGIQLGGTTYAMENDGEVVSGGLDNAVPGDIILFYTGSISPNCSSHVGIYAGDGQMVHCSGGRSNTWANPGTGVCMKAVAADGRPYEIRRVLNDVTYSSSAGGTGVGGYNIDPTDYSQSELELIWAIVAQEDNGSYEGSLAVISTAMNRVDSPQWSSLGSNALQQLTASGQFCYSIDTYWQARLGGNVPDFTKQAVSDCLDKGIRNHTHTSFRSGYVTGSERIGTNGNYYFD